MSGLKYFSKITAVLGWKESERIKFWIWYKTIKKM